MFIPMQLPQQSAAPEAKLPSQEPRGGNSMFESIVETLRQAQEGGLADEFVFNKRMGLAGAAPVTPAAPEEAEAAGGEVIAEGAEAEEVAVDAETPGEMTAAVPLPDDPAGWVARAAAPGAGRKQEVAAAIEANRRPDPAAGPRAAGAMTAPGAEVAALRLTAGMAVQPQVQAAAAQPAMPEAAPELPATAAPVLQFRSRRAAPVQPAAPAGAEMARSETPAVPGPSVQAVVQRAAARMEASRSTPDLPAAAARDVPPQVSAAPATPPAQPAQPAGQAIAAGQGELQPLMWLSQRMRAEGEAAPFDPLAGSSEELLQTAPARDAAPLRGAGLADQVWNRPGTPQAVMRQIAEMAPRAAGRPIELTLNPEELGSVRMNLSFESGAVAVSVVAERGETLDLLRRHIAELSQEFRQMGYADVDFSFSHQQESFQQARDDEAVPSGGALPGAEPAAEAEQAVPVFVRNTDQLDIRV